MSFDDQLERAQADGRMSPGDADEVRHFAGFLTALGAAEVPAGGHNRSPEQQRTFMRIYAEHYPEDYALAVAEARARHARERTERLEVDGAWIGITRTELDRVEQLAHDDPPAALELGRSWAGDPARRATRERGPMQYGHPTTSPASPGGPEPRGGPDT